MKIKSYNLTSGAKHGLLVLALTMFWGTAYSQTTYTFNYTGSSQTIALPSGNYSIQCWGANGGDATNSGAPMQGGKGGYASGTFSNPSSGVFNVYVGGKGGNTTAASTGAGGGGMSDVAPATNTNNLIIAAGGGGGATSGSASEASTGGHGGGLIGGTAVDGTGVSTGTAASGGSQTTGGVALAGSYGAGSPGGFGYGGGGANGGTQGVIHGPGGPGGSGGVGGWNGGGGGCTTTTGNEHAAGGGAGYYGGGGGRGDGGAGGGGSSYIGGLSSAVTYSFGQAGYVPNPVSNGNGYVLITEMCNISLVASTSNSLNPSICAGESVTLTTDAVSGYTWSTGANTSSLVVSPTSNTVYGLEATAASSCTTSRSITILVASGVPVLTVSTNPPAICQGKTVTLTASGALTYSWTSPVINGVSFTPPASGNYTVTGENGCGTSTAVASVSIHPTPTLSPISAVNPTICSGGSSTLTASGSGIAAYMWSTSASTNSIVVSPSSTTNYSVTAISAQGCTTSAARIVTVVVTPSLVPVASPAAMCLGNSSNLTAVATNYTWLPGNSNGSSLLVTPATSGVHTYTVIKANGVCMDTRTLAVTVYSLPVVSSFATPTAICTSIQSTTLTGTGGVSYTWAPAGGTSSTAVVTVSANTIFTVTASDGTCTAKSSIQINALPLPVVVASASSPSNCTGGLITLSASGAVTYTWSPGALPFAVVPVFPTSSTVFYVTGESSDGCVSTESVSITTYTNPLLNLTVDKAVVCTGEPAMLTVSGADTYLWNTTSTTTNITVNPTQSTMYSVIGTNTLGNCTSSQSVTVNVLKPTVSVIGTNPICEGNSATLTANANGAISYKWSNGFLGQNNVVSPKITTVYMATASVADQNIVCDATELFTVTVNPRPNINANADVSLVCLNEPVTVSVTGAASYSWSWAGQTSTSQSFTVTATQLPNMFFNVIGKDGNGCTNTAMVTVEVHACTGIDEIGKSNTALLVYPNPAQDRFTIALDQSSLTAPVDLLLINETGQVIRTLNFNGENDYKVSVSDLSNGIYFITGQSGTLQIKDKVIVQR